MVKDIETKSQKAAMLGNKVIVQCSLEYFRAKERERAREKK